MWSLVGWKLHHRTLRCTHTPPTHPEPLHGNVRFVKQPLSPRLQTAQFFLYAFLHPVKQPCQFSIHSDLYSTSGFFWWKKAKTRPNVTKVANFTENRPHFTWTPLISIPTCHKKLGRVRAREKNSMCKRAPTVYPP